MHLDMAADNVENYILNDMNLRWEIFSVVILSSLGLPIKVCTCGLFSCLVDHHMALTGFL